MADEIKQESEQPKEEKKVKKSKKGVWTVIGIIALALVVIGGAGGGYLIHLSNTSPEFCATCHIMVPNVDSYLTSNNLDNIHEQGNVACKECHDYPIPAEIRSGIKYILGDYTVDAEGKLLPVTYDDDMCFKCHISYDYIAFATNRLDRNPHQSHNGELPCKTCHVSHGEQFNYCAQCHDNGGQRMFGED